MNLFMILLADCLFVCFYSFVDLLVHRRCDGGIIAVCMLRSIMNLFMTLLADCLFVCFLFCFVDRPVHRCCDGGIIAVL